MRLIDADTIFNGKLLMVREEAYDAVHAVVERINNAPTVEAVPLEDYQSMEQTVNKLRMALADAEPVRHGRWKIKTYPGLIGECAYCSVCGYENCYEEIFSFGGYGYCPNCGAKMDESTMGQVKPNEGERREDEAD